MQAKKIILGIDPGIGRTGWGVIEAHGMDLKAAGFGCVTTPSNTPVGGRLVELETDLKRLIERYNPDVVAVEQLLFTNNITTGIAVGGARGVVLLVAERSGIPVVELTPTQVKLGVTGYGAADKRQVIDMVCRILKLNAAPKLDDAADALAVAICASGIASTL